MDSDNRTDADITVKELADRNDLSVAQVIKAVDKLAKRVWLNRKYARAGGRKAIVDIDAQHLDAVIAFSNPEVAVNPANRATQAQVIEREARRLVAGMNVLPNDEKKKIERVKKSLRNQLDHERNTRTEGLRAMFDDPNYDPDAS